MTNINIEQQHEVVKDSLFSFVNSHISGADLSVVDDIVLSYVISILEEASQDPCFDVEGFIEMMSAYFVEFSEINPTIVAGWIFQLEKQLNNLVPKSEETSHLSFRYFFWDLAKQRNFLLIIFCFKQFLKFV